MVPKRPFAVCIALALAAVSGCVREDVVPYRKPAWLANNLPFVQASVAGTVLIDARPPGDGPHKGGVGTVLGHRRVVMPLHVVKDAGSVFVHTRRFYDDPPRVELGEMVGGTVIAFDEENDAALFVAVAELDSTPMRIDRELRPAAAQHVWYFGKGHAVQHGKVLSPSALAGPMQDTVQVDMPAGAGDSGAPLVTDDGAVVGFLYATSTDSTRTYFIPAGRALSFVGKW